MLVAFTEVDDPSDPIVPPVGLQVVVPCAQVVDMDAPVPPEHPIAKSAAVESAAEPFATTQAVVPVPLPVLSNGAAVNPPENSFKVAHIAVAPVCVKVGAVSPAAQFGLYQMAQPVMLAADDHPEAAVVGAAVPFPPTQATNRLPAVVAFAKAGATLVVAEVVLAPPATSAKLATQSTSQSS
jgi:hypothetical protein